MMKVIMLMIVVLTSHYTYCQTYIDVFGVAGEIREDFMMVTGEVFFIIAKDDDFSQGFTSITFEIEEITDVSEVFNGIDVKVYPNPTSDFISVAIPLELVNNSFVSFHDLSGRVLFTEKITGELSLFNLQNYKSSMIIMMIFSNNKILKSYKIQVINK